MCDLLNAVAIASHTRSDGASRVLGFETDFGTLEIKKIQGSDPARDTVAILAPRGVFGMLRQGALDAQAAIERAHTEKMADAVRAAM